MCVYAHLCLSTCTCACEYVFHIHVTSRGSLWVIPRGGGAFPNSWEMLSQWQELMRQVRLASSQALESCLSLTLLCWECKYASPCLEFSLCWFSVLNPGPQVCKASTLLTGLAPQTRNSLLKIFMIIDFLIKQIRISVMILRCPRLIKEPPQSRWRLASYIARNKF